MISYKHIPWLLALLILVSCTNIDDNSSLRLNMSATTHLQDSTGVVRLEAEDFDSSQEHNGQSWQPISEGGAWGSKAVQALPDRDVSYGASEVADAPRLSYIVKFDRAGTHYIWVRGKGNDKDWPTSDSVHVGLSSAAGGLSEIRVRSSAYKWSQEMSGGAVATLDVPSAGEHTINVWMREDGFVFDALELTLSPGYTPGDAAPHQQGADGLIEIDAVNFQGLEPKNGQSWQRVENGVDSEAMQALPDSGETRKANSVSESPRLDYRITFENAGMYYIWLRGRAAGSSVSTSDSVHVGLDGQTVRTGNRITDFGPNLNWVNETMDGEVARLEVATPGEHTLNVWMREDGLTLSQLVLTQDASYQPSITSSSRASRAADFIDTIGVNTHLHYTDRVYYKEYGDIIKKKLIDPTQGLGVRHIRDRAYTHERVHRNHFYYKRLRELGAAGVRFNLTTSLHVDHAATDYSKLDDIVSWTDGAVVSFEGVNEPNEFGPEEWIEPTRETQMQLYSTVKGNPALDRIKVLGPSPTAHESHLGDLSAYMDYGATHPYPGGKMPTGSENGRSTESLLKNAARVSGDKPIIVTETGYHNAVNVAQTEDHKPTSEEAAAKYFPRLFFEHFNIGIPRSYIYEFIDGVPDTTLTNREASFGLLRNDGSEKPAFKAVKNLIALLKDMGPDSTSFTPGTLTFTLSGETSGVHHALLQKGNGVFYLALWLEKPSWDRHAREDLAVPPQALELTLGSSMKGATLYAFDGAGLVSKRSASLRDGKRLGFSVGDTVTVLELRP